jgi:hypothetical protein
MRTAEGRRLFRERVAELCTAVFLPDKIAARVDEIEAQLQSALASWNGSAARAQAHQATWFKQRVRRRAEELQRQLSVPPPAPLTFGSDGAVHLTGWKPSRVRSGDPSFREAKDAQGNASLVIAASGRGVSSGSWRTRALLPEGHYRLEGLVRLSNVEIDGVETRGGGACLRISKGPSPARLTGSGDWRSVVYEFQQDAVADVEFICELKARTGQAGFDLASLQLVRVR